MNPITGEKTITINEERYTVRYTWKALAEIETKHGDSPNLFNAEIVSDIAAIGIRDKHPDMTPEKIMELSPPLMPFVRDIQQALQWAYFGNEVIPVEEEPPVKKNHRMVGFYQRMARLFRRG